MAKRTLTLAILLIGAYGCSSSSNNAADTGTKTDAGDASTSETGGDTPTDHAATDTATLLPGRE